MTLREVRDAVHGLIELEVTEWDVIDSPAFQRLRGVQQLAMTHLVYPGARHSRFEHCVGACHVAGRIADHVDDGAAGIVDKDWVRLAALTHDIGHGPFSHVSEEVFEELTGRKDIHESLSAAIVTKDPIVSGALGEDAATWISDLLLHVGVARNRTIERDIVSGPADIDKLDYLLRDSQYCGVNYGRYDLSKVIESSMPFTDEFGDTYLAFHEDGIYALEEMLLARYHMHRQVYGHKTRVGIDRMLVRAMLTGVDEGLLDRDVFAPPEELSTEFVAAYLEWDDAAVIKRLIEAPKTSIAGQIMRALVERRLCKRILRLDSGELASIFGDGPAAWIANADGQTLREHRPVVEAEIAAVAGIAPHWVILNWEDRKSQVSLPGDARISPKDIVLVNSRSEHFQFHERSEVFTKEAIPSQQSISVYLGCDEGSRRKEFEIPPILDSLTEGLDRIGRAAKAV